MDDGRGFNFAGKRLIGMKKAEIKPVGIEAESVNLIPDVIDSEKLVVAPNTELVGDPFLQHFHTVTTNEGVNYEFFVDLTPGARSVVIKTYSGGEWRVCGALATAPYAAITMPSGDVTLATATGMRTLMLGANGRWTLAADAQGMTPVVRAVDPQPFFATTAEMEVEVTDARTPEVTEGGRAKLGTALADAYLSMATEASALGRWVQPVMMQLRYIDSAGGECGRSLPIVVSYGGWQSVGEMESEPSAAGNGKITVPMMRVEAAGFRAGVRFPQGVDAGVSHVEVWALPQHHPVDVSAPLSCRLVERNSGLKMWCVLPGAAWKFSDLDTERREALMSVAPLCGEGHVVARIEADVLAKGDEVIINAPMRTPLWEMARMKKLQSMAIETRATGSNMMERLEAGSRFTARRVARSGSVVAWGDVSLLPERGENAVGLLCGGSGDAMDYEVAVIVSYADGRIMVTRHEDYGVVPDSLVPFVAVASAKAVKIKVMVEDETGRVREREVALMSSVHGGELTCYMARRLDPMLLVDTDMGLPAPTEPVEERYASAVVICSSSAPLRPIAATLCGDGAVKALVPAMRSRSSWDVSRARFYAFMPHAVHAVVAGAATVSAVMVHGGSLNGCDAVAYTPCGVMAAMGRKIGCARGGAIDEVRVEKEFKMLAWHGGLSKLLGVDGGGNAWLMTVDAAGKVTHTTAWQLPYTPISVSEGVGGILLASDAGTHLLASDAGRAATSYVKMTAEVEAPCSGVPVKLVLAMAAKRFNGYITLKAHGGAGRDYAMMVGRWHAHGEVNHKMLMRVCSPPRSHYVLEVEGDVSDDFWISKSELYFLR